MSLPSLQEALASLPAGLCTPLINEFEQSLAEYRAADWEKVGLKAGKFCEIAYCICLGHASDSYPSAPSKPSNFPQACRDLEQFNKLKGRSICIQIPKILVALYELRNNRAIGHISGDISPNHLDAEIYLSGMKWVMGELVRNYSQLSLEMSRDIVEAVITRTIQIVWSSEDLRRVLDPKRTTYQKVLILLYAEGRETSVSVLQGWVEYKNTTNFRNKILKKLHSEALIHYNESKSSVIILPTGQVYVEKNKLLEIIL